jgi:hypothetical protein
LPCCTLVAVHHPLRSLTDYNGIDARSSLLLSDNAVPKTEFATHDTVSDGKRPDTMQTQLILHERVGVTIPGLAANKQQINAAFVRTAPWPSLS